MTTATSLLRFLSCCVALALAISALAQDSKQEVRTWTQSATGKKLEGEFVRMKDDKTAIIKFGTGAAREVPIAMLSEDDQKFLAEQSGDMKPEEAAPATKDDATKTDAPATPAKEGAFIEVKAADIAAEYSNDSAAADAKYKGNTLLVTGEIEDVGVLDIGDGPAHYITLATDEMIMVVQCMFKADPKAPKPGKKATVKGRCDGGGGNVLLRECVIE